MKYLEDPNSGLEEKLTSIPLATATLQTTMHFKGPYIGRRICMSCWTYLRAMLLKDMDMMNLLGDLEFISSLTSMFLSCVWLKNSNMISTNYASSSIGVKF